MKKLFKLSFAVAFLLTAQISFSQDFNFQLRATMDFPGQTLANVCGYWQNGQEYALLGGSQGLIIVNITNPASPQQIVQIPGVNDLWKEIKVYSHYAYITSEGSPGSQGVQIVDLSPLPSASLPTKNYHGDGAIANQLNTIHALHIDVKKGFLYAYGSNLFSGGAVVLDLSDPWNPKYVGKFDQEGYIHDGFADNDTLYSCHIYKGTVDIVDMADKANPVLLGTVETPGKFTHNAWMTGDRQHILTTDEATPSFLASYDVSDPSNIQFLDKVSPNDGNGSYVHNTHIINDYAVTSWYTDGVLTVDAHRPDNLIIVGRYDTYASSILEFEGCWGVFPFFPSGTVITSDIDPGQMTVLTPTYKRACYLEGKITNGCNGQPLAGASVKINGSTDPIKIGVTKANGLYKTGQVTPGNFTATISAPGLLSKTVSITLATGQVTELNVTLDAGQVFTANGVVSEVGTNAPIANAQVTLKSAANAYTLTTNATGQFSLDCVPAGVYTATAGKWGYVVNSVAVNQSGATLIQLAKGYYDDFATDLGWTTGSTADAGDWVRGEPEGTTNQGNLVNPEYDMNTDNNDQCYMTGNGGGSAGANDVDLGKVSLFTPVMKLAGYQDAVLSYYFWFYNAQTQGNPPNDKFEVDILNGNQTIHVLTETVSQSAWRYSGEIHLKDFTTLTDNIRIEFSATDVPAGNWLESAIDIFKMTPTTVGVQPDLDDSATLSVSPNPSASDFSIQFSWENADENPVLEVRNLLGQVVFSEKLASKTGLATLGNHWNAGVYFASLRSAGRSSAAVKLVKQ